MTPALPHPQEMGYKKLVKGFRRSLGEATRGYAVAKGLQLRLAKDPALNEHLNRNPWTWETILTSLQIAYVIGISKLSDSNSESSLEKIVSFCEANVSLFQREALLSRKTGQSNIFYDVQFADSYMSECYFPRSDEFRMMLQEVGGFDSLQDSIRRLRNKVFAHDDLLDMPVVVSHFSVLVNTDVEALIAKCNVLINELDSGLFNNGHKPDFSKVRAFDDLPEVQSIYEEVLRMSLG